MNFVKLYVVIPFSAIALTIVFQNCGGIGSADSSLSGRAVSSSSVPNTGSAPVSPGAAAPTPTPLAATVIPGNMKFSFNPAAAIPNAPAVANYYSTYTFVVPQYTTLTVKVWGGGGGGYNGGSAYANSTFGSIFSGTGVAAASGGAGGVASGGDTNVNGNAGIGAAVNPIAGGNAPFGGTGANASGCVAGGTPGGGGAGAGSGAFAEKTYHVGDLTPGSTISITVASGGIGAGGSVCQAERETGGDGEVDVSWQ